MNLSEFNRSEKIANGSFSTIYLCEYNDTRYIIKEINLNVLVKKYTSHETHHYFKKLDEIVKGEIEVLKLLNHENIIRLHSFDLSDKIYYLKMEYCDAGHISSSTVSNPVILMDFLQQTSRALSYIHDKHIIHRDIKPQNILVQKCRDKLVFKLSDFGFACYDLTENAENIMSVVSKKYFKLCGTPLYMAPEILNNKEFKATKYFYSKSVDCWSYGLCIYELLHGKLPFPKIKNILELETFMKRDDIQSYFEYHVHSQGHQTYLKKLLGMLLQVFPQDRATSKDIVNVLNQIHIVNEVNEVNKVNKVNKVNEVNEVNESWQHISTSTSFIKNLDVDKEFCEWLMNTN